MDANKYRTAYDKAQAVQHEVWTELCQHLEHAPDAQLLSDYTATLVYTLDKDRREEALRLLRGQLYSRQLRDTGRVESWFTDCGARMGQDIEGFVANARQQYVQAGLAEEQRAEAEAKQKAGRGRFRIRPASAFAPERAAYLVQPYLPRGMVSILGGVSAAGKTSLALDVCARLTRGAAFAPEDPPQPPATVLYLTAENDPNKVLRPRAEAMGADLDRLYFQDGASYSMGDEELAALCRVYRPALLVFDPIQSYLGQGGRKEYNMELQEIRNEIDRLDKQIQSLFEERMLLCQDVARYKKAHNMPVFQAGREQQILDRVEQNAKEGLGLASRTMFANMMSISSQLQQKMLVAAEDAPSFKTPRMKEAVRVGCQGTVGANSETAAQAFFPERHIQFYPTFEQVFEAVESGELEYGVLPIYNSTSGTVTQTVDLMGKYSFFITAMNQVEVMHCLAALPDAKMENITEVYSHPQALSQCSDFLDARSLHSHDYSNTATAAKMVAESGDKTIAAICSEDCAKHNRLQILASRISNVVPNFTQFICITKDMQVAENASVISVMLSISNEPGSLSRILNKFFLYGLDMTKIESRPIRDGSFDVVFHIDFKGNLRDRSIAAFLNDLCKSCRDFKLLGNAVVMV